MEGGSILNFIPGPVTPSPRVMRALSQPMPYHRGEEFSSLYREIGELMRPLFGSEEDLVIVSGSSTAGIEAGISGFVRGRRALTLVDGKFGERLHLISSMYAREARRVESEWGTTPSQEELESSLSGVDVLLVVHNETSTGVEHDLDLIADLAKDRGVDLLVDVVSSVGGVEVRGDEWGAKALFGGVQKCVGAPPGLAPVMVREWDGYRGGPFYLDLLSYREALRRPLRQTPFTPALPLFSALRAALREVHDEGLENRFHRHERLAEILRRGLEEMGIELFARPRDLGRLSSTVTSFLVPGAEEVRQELARIGVMVAGGQGPLKGRILRAATMANIAERDVKILLSNLREILRSG